MVSRSYSVLFETYLSPSFRPVHALQPEPEAVYGTNDQRWKRRFINTKFWRLQAERFLFPRPKPGKGTEWAKLENYEDQKYGYDAKGVSGG